MRLRVWLVEQGQILALTLLFGWVPSTLQKLKIADIYVQLVYPTNMPSQQGIKLKSSSLAK